MAWPPILVRYGEIGIKSRNIRAQFERRLAQQIEGQLIRRGIEAELSRDQGRMLLRASDTDAAVDALAHTFGVVSASPTAEVDPTPDAVADQALAIAREELPQGGSFAMKCKRAGVHDFTSLDVAKTTAARIFDGLPEREPRVDLDNPDLDIRSEVRTDRAYVYTKTVPGPGGLPMGSQGKTAILVDGPRSAHTAWLLAKRGSALVFLTAHPEQAADWTRPLEPWMGPVKFVPLTPGDRRSLYEQARPVLERNKCHALAVSDDAAGAVAFAEDDKALGHPVFRPLVGYHGPRFVALSRQAELPEDV